MLLVSIVVLVLSLSLHFGLRAKKAHSLNIRPTPVAPVPHPNRPTTSSLRGPVIDRNFADPCFIDVNGIYYAFATNKYVRPQPGNINIQFAVSPDFNDWSLTIKDALPKIGAWAMDGLVWAPDVVRLDDGSFVMYYSARPALVPHHHCVGAATSKTVQGPYEPLPKPLVCPLNQGGAIDPDGFQDVDGSRYMIYKVDGNSLNNLTHNEHPTPLMLQQVDPVDGVTLVSSPVKLLDRVKQDGPLIEGPAISRISRPSPIYLLFFSSNVFTTPLYDISYATSTTGIKGPYTRSNIPLLMTGDDGGKLYGPGGLDVGVGGQKVVFHSIKEEVPGLNVTRTMWTGKIVVNGTVVSI